MHLYVVLVVGSGGREDAIVWKLAQSQHVRKIIVAPGNGGTSYGRGRWKTDVEIVQSEEVSKNDQIVRLAKSEGVDLVFVGPEVPLAEGLADSLCVEGIRCFGPSGKAAQIEASKAFSKEFMIRHNIPTAIHKTFTNVSEAIAYIDQVNFDVVIKASGLAAGKGVIIPDSKESSKKAVTDMITNKLFGEAGNTVVIEQFLVGEEASFLSFTDGTHFVAMPAAQDHKRIFDGDHGPNTGGMGAFAPTPTVDERLFKEVVDTIVAPAIKGLREEGRPFVGVLYAGVILTKDGPRCLEYNCRFGDPETQALLPLLKTDLMDIAMACCTQRLSEVKVEFENSLFAATVVAASKGYPDSYPKGIPISGIDTFTDLKDTFLFHAGTILTDKGVVTSGGRVLAVSGVAQTLSTAIGKAYSGLQKISFEGMQYRKDIGGRKLKKVKIGILGSTRGTDMQAIIDAIERREINAEISVVISNVQDAYILERSRRHNLNGHFVPSKGRKREEFEKDVFALLQSSGVELVLLIGFMRIVSPFLISKYNNRMLNVHPSLLPEFAGGMDLDVHSEVLKAGKRVSGCTVHFVTEQVDKGGIVIQKSCSIEDNETPDSLKQKVQKLEGEALVECIRMYQQERLGV